MTSETRGRNILATELLKDGYHERAERVAAGNEFMSDEPAVRACVAAVGAMREEAAKVAEDKFADPAWGPHYRNAAQSIAFAIRAIGDETALALPSPVRQGEDGGGIGGLREELRVLMLEQPISGTRETYSDGFAQGLCHAIWRIDALPALSPVREPVLEPGVIDRVMDLIEQRLCIIWWPVENRDIFVAALKDALDPDFTGHIDCPEDEGGSDHAD